MKLEPVMSSKNCIYCKVPVNPRLPTTYRRIEGWEQKAQSAIRRSGSDVLLREPRDEYACEACIVKLKRAKKDRVAAGQDALL